MTNDNSNPSLTNSTPQVAFFDDEIELLDEATLDFEDLLGYEETPLLLVDGFSLFCFALVIANAAYPTAPLANPLRDAKRVSEALEAVGFTVEQATDLAQVDIRVLESER